MESTVICYNFSIKSITKRNEECSMFSSSGKNAPKNIEIKTTEDAAKALCQLVDESNLDVGGLFTHVADKLKLEKATTQKTVFKSEPTFEPNKDELLLHAYNNLTKSLHDLQPLANTPYNIDFVEQILTNALNATIENPLCKDVTEDKIAEALQSLLDNPELAKKYTALSTAQQQGLRILSSLIRQEKTAIDKYNLLTRNIITSTAFTPLSDTQSNSEFAQNTLDKIIESTKKELSNIDADEIDKVITASISNTESNVLYQNNKLIKETLEKHLRESQHHALEIYNKIQSKILENDIYSLDNTVENNELATNHLIDIQSIVSNKYGKFLADDILDDFVNDLIPEFDSATPEQKGTIESLTEYFHKANNPHRIKHDKSTIYENFIEKILNQDARIRLQDKIDLLDFLSKLIHNRQTDEMKRENFHIDAISDFLNNNSITAIKELGIHLIQKLYATRFISINPNISIDSNLEILNSARSKIDYDEEEQKQASAQARIVEEYESDDEIARHAKQPMQQQTISTVHQEQKQAEAEDKETETREFRSNADEPSNRAPGERIHFKEEEATPSISKQEQIKQSIAANIAARKQREQREQREQQAREEARLQREHEQANAEQANIEAYQQTLDPIGSALHGLQHLDQLPSDFLTKRKTNEHIRNNSLWKEMHDIDIQSDDSVDTLQISTSSIAPSQIPRFAGAGVGIDATEAQLHDKELKKETLSSSKDIDVGAIKTQSQNEESKQEAPSGSRQYIPAPSFETESNVRAMRDHMYDYAMELLPSISEGQQKRISLLLHIIKACCLKNNIAVMIDENKVLTKMFAKINAERRPIESSHLDLVQKAVISQAKKFTHWTTHNDVSRLITQLNNETKSQATPSANQKLASQFIQRIPYLYAEYTDESHAQDPIYKANKEREFQTEFKDFYKQLCRNNYASEIQQMTAQERIGYEKKLQNHATQFMADFLQSLDSKRLIKVRDSALQLLDNLERFHASAFAHQHPSKATFSAHRKEIAETNMNVKSAEKSEKNILDSLNRLIARIGHHVTIEINESAFLETIASSAEDSQLQPSTSTAVYLKSIDEALFKTIASSAEDRQLRILTCATFLLENIHRTIDAYQNKKTAEKVKNMLAHDINIIQTNMQSLLKLDLTTDSDKNKLPAMIEKMQEDAIKLGELTTKVMNDFPIDAATSSSSQALGRPSLFAQNNDASVKEIQAVPPQTPPKTPR